LLFNSGLGIEISDHQVNLVYLKASFKGIAPAAEYSFSLDADQPQKERLEDIAGFINGFIREHRISAAHIHLGIPGDLAILRQIDFPLAVKENLRETLEYEMEKYVPLPTAEICFDFQVIFEDKAAEKLTVLLVVVRREDIAPYLQLADFVEKGISGIEITPAALSNYYLDRMRDCGDSAVIVYAKDRGVDVVYVKQGALVYSRTMGKTAGGDGGPSSVTAHLMKARGVFEDPDQRIPLVVLGDAVADEITGDIADQLRFDVVKPAIHQMGVSAERYVPAFGLALKGIQNLPVQVNLMPPGKRRKPDKTGRMVMLALCVLLVLSGVVWSVSHVISARRTLNGLDAALDRLRAEAAAVERIEAQSAKIRERIDYLASLRTGNQYAMDVLKELSSVFPMTAWVNSFKLSGNELSLYGAAESASELISILEEVPMFTDVRFLSTIRKGKDGREIFRIGLRISGHR